MQELTDLLDKNRQWSEAIRHKFPDFFPTLAAQQSPQFLWIGCADSRVPANDIVGLLPGELFVHRNVSNLVIQTDINCLSVLQYAVEVLQVKHVMVVGHYGCGGIKAALDGSAHGLIDNWLGHVRDVYGKHAERVGEWLETPSQFDLMCELNVLEQARNVCRTTILQQAWTRGQTISVHAWVYGLSNGLVKNLQFSVPSTAAIEHTYQHALAQIHATT